VQEAYQTRLLAVTLDDLRRVAGTYLTPGRAAYALVAGRDPNTDVKDLGLTFEVEKV
jgi:Zn-dependent M16 (insulinase) family peptidase